MSSSEISDTAVRCYQELGWKILKQTAMPTLACLLSVLFVLDWIIPAFLRTSHAGNTGMEVAEAAFNLGVGVFIAGPLFLLGVSYSSAIVTSLVSDYMNGVEPNEQTARARAKQLLPKLFGLTTLQLLTASITLVIAVGLLMIGALTGDSSDTGGGIATGLAILAFIISIFAVPGILTYQGLAFPTMLIEQLGVRASLKRGVMLAKRTRYQPGAANVLQSLALMLLVVATFILFGIWGTLNIVDIRGEIRSALIGTAFHDIALFAYDSIPIFLTLWVTIPVWCATTTILYFERRARLEGYDIEALAKDVFNNAKSARILP